MREKDLANIVTRPSRPPDWLVPGMLHKGTMVVLAGAPGSGKSVLSLCLTVAKATGFPFLGRDLTQGRVLYFDEENSQPDFEEYLRWIWRGLGRPEPKLLNDNIQMERFSLAHAARTFKGQYKYMEQCVKEFQPELVIVDTATPACQIKDENDNAMATEAIGELRVVQQACDNSTMLILKHAKVDSEHGTHTVRGAKAWVGSTDATIFHMGVTGRERQDGLRDSQLVPEKIRAFGLQATLRIHPTWTGPHEDKGLQLEVAQT